ncbi:hypothetical protein Ahy_A06g026309 [Arachis hypogaea]|uniref:Uncharacterized protein n=1 Tax=Arachis hypogaea TaxID=3818 RepID=A0A445CK48_ARAHY|nr:hypothetical protein Ahy_A06g026309 [Arachis hypogaea]
MTSLWSEHFPFTVLADEHGQSPADVKLVHEVGDVGVAQYLQVIGARLMCIGQTEELKHSKTAFDKAAMDQLMQENLEKSSKLRDALDMAEAEKEDHGLEMFSAGFERAVEQIKFLVPTVDLSRMNPCKVAIGNELVEDEDGVEGEGENPDV